MYYELIILGTLMSGPFHGYLIAKIMQNILGPYGQLSKGRLYPLLTKLEEAGLIMVKQVSEQQEKLSARRSHIPSRSFQITEAGRKRLHELLLDTTSYPGEYQKLFLQKVTYFSFLQPEERLHLIEQYLSYCQSLISYGTTRAEALANAGGNPQESIDMTSAQLADLLIAMRHKIHQWQQELLWAEELREQVKARMDAPPTSRGGALS